MSEYEIVWSGRGSLTRSEGWSYRGNYLLEAAPGPGNWIRVNDPALKNAPTARSFNNSRGRQVGRPPGRTVHKCGCGRIRSKRAKRCIRCVKLNRRIRSTAA